MKKRTFDPNILALEVLDYMFVEWLRDHNLYSKFVANLSSVKRDSDSPRFAIRVLIARLIAEPYLTLGSAISLAFAFHKTPEGANFWIAASNDWRSYLKSFSSFI